MPLSKLVLIQDNFWLKSGKGLVVEKPVLLPLKPFPVACVSRFMPTSRLPSCTQQPEVYSAGYKHCDSSASKPFINSHHTLLKKGPF